MALCFCLFGFSSALRAQNARIKIDVDRVVGAIDPNIYGNFVEHLGRCVYGGIYEPGSPLSDEHGFRRDVMEAVKELNVPLIRYPGGNFVSNYHWLDGVGPERIPRMELAWERLETNEFGTNEFVRYARAIGTEPYFAVNLGTGTIEEARRWVEYCNVEKGSFYAELRRKHGFEQPHNILYWGLGNEMDGDWQMGHLNAEDYSKKAKEAAKLMRMTSPGIRLVASGSSNYRPDADPDHWNATVLNQLRDEIDYIALHIYVGNVGNDYYRFLSTPQVMEQRTQVVKGMILREMQHARRGNRPPIYIAWDEYNVWYRARGGADAVGTHALEERYNLEDALVVSGFLNVFIRNADFVKMANMAQLVNVIAPIFTNEQGMFKQTIFYPLQLFANHMKGMSLDVSVACDTYDAGRFTVGMGETATRQAEVPYLDVSAALDGDTLSICVLNRHLEKGIPTELICQEGAFGSSFEVYEVNGSDIKAVNDFGRTNVQTTKQPNVVAKGQKLTYTFAPHSLTLLKGKVSR